MDLSFLRKTGERLHLFVVKSHSRVANSKMAIERMSSIIPEPIYNVARKGVVSLASAVVFMRCAVKFFMVLTLLIVLLTLLI